MLGNAISIWRVRSSMPMASFEYRDSKERMMKRGLDAGRWTLDAGRWTLDWLLLLCVCRVSTCSE